MARYEEALDHAARARKAGTKKELAEISIRHAENGGHIVTHRYKDGENGGYRAPEDHVFSEGHGEELMKHIAKHMQIPRSEEHGKESEEPATDGHADPAAE